ncbi:hypothetical protein ACFL6W_03565 [Thermodesulfobacteriota bacterium]
MDKPTTAIVSLLILMTLSPAVLAEVSDKVASPNSLWLSFAVLAFLGCLTVLIKWWIGLIIQSLFVFFMYAPLLEWFSSDEGPAIAVEYFESYGVQVWTANILLWGVYCLSWIILFVRKRKQLNNLS